jgi:two-component system cell cycle sensor histidine kinase/response regulator CckA
MKTKGDSAATAAPDTHEKKRRSLRVLIAEDTQRDTDLAMAALRRAGYEVAFDLATTPEHLQQLLKESSYDVVVSDHNLRTWTGRDALDILQRSQKEIPFIVMTGSLGDEAAVEYLRHGAADYVLKHRLEQLPTAVEHALNDRMRRNLEEQLRQAQKMEAIGQLASGVAHDFNNVLCAILGYSDLLLEDTSLNWHARGRVTEIRTAANRASEITQQMLAFSRKQVLQPRPLDLNAVVQETSKMLRRLIGEDIRLITNLHSDLWTVKADPTQIHQIIVNLAVNARDAMPEGGKLTIDTGNVEIDESYSDRHIHVEPGYYVLLAVTDTGTGMDAATQKQIFEPFFTTKRGRGTGLGLSTVYGIVKQSSGYVWVYSEPGHGTTFKIYLPRVEGKPAPLVAASQHAAPQRGSETVLLVEDDAALRELNREQLRAMGYNVLAAAHGEAALALAAQHSGEIHLMMTDVVMPGINGRQLVERLHEQRPEMRVLYVSGYTENVIQQEILNSGVAFLQKPFARDVLNRKLRELLDVRG